MKKELQLRGRDVVGKRVLILGEVSSGKTALLAGLLKELMGILDKGEITVIDFAPRRVGEIGGKMSKYMDSINGVKYLSPKIVCTPRLSGHSREEVLRYAELNRERMEPLLSGFIERATKVLILNDVTLYLHTGRLEEILNCMNLAETFLATAYYGSRLAEDHGAGISIREKKLVKKLVFYMDRTITVGKVS
jgi:hypothetical protein